MTIYKWENGGLKETVDFSSSCWINLSEPTTAELEQVLSFSQIPRDFLTDPLDREERPRFENEDGVSLVIVHVPYPVRGDEDDETVYRYLNTISRNDGETAAQVYSEWVPRTEHPDISIRAQRT